MLADQAPETDAYVVSVLIPDNSTSTLQSELVVVDADENAQKALSRWVAEATEDQIILSSIGFDPSNILHVASNLNVSIGGRRWAWIVRIVPLTLAVSEESQQPESFRSIGGLFKNAGRTADGSAGRPVGFVPPSAQTSSVSDLIVFPERLRSALPPKMLYNEEEEAAVNQPEVLHVKLDAPVLLSDVFESLEEGRNLAELGEGIWLPIDVEVGVLPQYPRWIDFGYPGSGVVTVRDTPLALDVAGR